MAAAIEIANGALNVIGADPIVAFTDANKRAITCQGQYNLSRKEELRGANWSFAIKRTTLPALAAAPAFGYGYAYQLPVDFIRLVQVGQWFVGFSNTDYRTGPEAAYAIEDGKILTDLAAPLPIRYVYDLQNGQQFDALFVSCLTARLASDIALQLTQSTDKKREADKEWQLAMARALAANAIEKPPEMIPDEAWIMGRL